MSKKHIVFLNSIDDYYSIRQSQKKKVDLESSLVDYKL